MTNPMASAQPHCTHILQCKRVLLTLELTRHNDYREFVSGDPASVRGQGLELYAVLQIPNSALSARMNPSSLSSLSLQAPARIPGEQELPSGF